MVPPCTLPEKLAMSGVISTVIVNSWADQFIALSTVFLQRGKLKNGRGNENRPQGPVASLTGPAYRYRPANRGPCRKCRVLDNRRAPGYGLSCPGSRRRRCRA